MFGAGEPKPAVLVEKDLSKFVQVVGKIEASSIRHYLAAVVGPRNRFAAQKKMVEVENYIHEAFTECGWTVEKQKYRYETFDGYDTKAGHTKKQYHDLEGVNIIAQKPGKNPDQIVLIGAHYDTRDDTPGADDNGTGIAALLELARVLREKRYSKTLVLVAFDMEEIGLAGSKAFVEKLSPKGMIKGAIIFESVGFFTDKENTQKIPHGFSSLYRQQVGKVEKRQFRGDFVTVIHNGGAKKLASLLGGANKVLDEAVQFVFIRDPLDLPVLGAILRRLFPALRHLLRSDHVPFWETGIPAVQLTDTANFRNPNYHHPSDTIETISFPMLQRLVQVVAATAILLVEANGDEKNEM